MAFGDSGQSLPYPQLDALQTGAHRLSMLTDEGLYRACGVRLAFTGREGGTSEGVFGSLNCSLAVGDDERRVLRNRQLVAQAIGAEDAPVVVPNQVHGTTLACVSESEQVPSAMAVAQAGADAVLVQLPGVAALLNFADCLPLILVAPAGAFAVVHAGWRGAVARIASMAALELARRSGCEPASLNAYVGPHIRSECFEVGEEVALAFSDEFGDSVLADDRHVSLSAAVSSDLIQMGFDAGRIADAGICTKCNSDRYFSYRASDGRCGRHCAVAFRRESR